ncbi:response regulator transcription factor [Leadbetterella byssophila]|jgi:two-component system copper resistance phosphate regulon response regulator CusR|uniref:Two component transcriptional regulator, winged helix family n=1 Tax=Leadbetterella byssophila (strain DSM 17132 / JCM 16389 / KACC 11308 / NBRC 106382 / 4M15) TaxID=649349 RepID=E4RYU4_LEAB4|nr:response regulator transcription factor [Leadbetterella byssophila]ADQ17341.1 two component transcriptional regulator, winged helix family [Leadbetterella byssophila DSM 17132]
MQGLKILLIEDEVKTLNLIKEGLEENNAQVDIAYDGQMGLTLAERNEYSLIISDIILPEINGLTLCKTLRDNGNHTPILLLTALGTTEDIITGLDSGADDYLSKPFEFSELRARIRALTRRGNAVIQKSNILRVADLELNVDTKAVKRGDKEITLTAKEFSLLEFFMSNVGRVISKVELAEKIWDITFDTGTNVIEVYVNFLRKKIDKDFDVKLIHTQIGMGYVMKC